jgi:hypothetical protein
VTPEGRRLLLVWTIAGICFLALVVLIFSGQW